MVSIKNIVALFSVMIFSCILSVAAMETSVTLSIPVQDVIGMLTRNNKKYAKQINAIFKDINQSSFEGTKEDLVNRIDRIIKNSFIKTTRHHIAEFVYAYYLEALEQEVIEQDQDYTDEYVPGSDVFLDNYASTRRGSPKSPISESAINRLTKQGSFDILPVTSNR